MEIDAYVVFVKVLDIFVLVFGYGFSVSIAVEPSFDVPVVNVTVVQGKEAILPCTVEYLGDHKVIWTDEWSTLFTFDVNRIIDDDRISVERPLTQDWNLLIRNVHYNDKGKYVCQINTEPVKTKTVILNVLVPPTIIDELSTDHIITNEGETVQLICNVTGVPTPTVHWYRQMYGYIPGRRKGKKERIGNTGEILIIHNVSRYCDGTYECVASNSVMQNVTREIHVQVEFKPEIVLPNKRIGQFQGKDTILECEITAMPQAYSAWKRRGQTLISDGKKYRIEVFDDEYDEHRITLSLRIIDVTLEDYGIYTCFAKNELGEDKEDMTLYESFPITLPPKTTTTEYETHTLQAWPTQGKIVNSYIETMIVTKGVNSPILAGRTEKSGATRLNGAQHSFISYKVFSISCMIILDLLKTGNIL